MLIVLVHRETSLFIFVLTLSRLRTAILTDRASGPVCPLLLLAVFRTGGGRGRFEYAPALIVVNESAGSAGRGMDLRGRRSFSVARGALHAHAALQIGGRTRRADIVFVAAD
jgi:hypothetical protein